MSKIEQSMEKALKLRDDPSPVKREVPLPPDHPPVNFGDYGKEPHLRDYLEVLLRRKWIVLVFLTAVVITVLIASFNMTPLYKSQTLVQLRSGKTALVKFRDVYQERLGLETEYNILSSKTLADRVAKKISPENIPPPPERRFLLSILDSIKSFIPHTGHKNKEPAVKEKVKRISKWTIIEGLETVPVKETDLVYITFTSHDPVFAAYAANKIADEYINFSEESKLKPTRLGGERLRKEVEDMKATLESSEKELNDYVAESQFLFTRNDESYDNLLANKFAKLTAQLDQAISERLSTETIYQQVKKSDLNYNIVLEKPIIQSLTKQLIDLEIEYSNLLLIHKPEYPRMVQLKDQIEKIKNKIEVEEQNIINTFHSDYILALKKEKVLSSAIEELRQDVDAFQQNMIQFLALKREVETNRGIYDSLLERLKEVDVSTALTESDVRILDRAEVPGRPFKPRMAFNILLSLVFGLFGGAFLAFFSEYFDHSVKTDEDVEKISRLPVLGKVPLENVNPQKLVNLMSGDNRAFPEAFRSIGTRIHSANLPKQILITSPMEQEGKTVISVSIAMSLISSQEKGILIDGDLRKPDIHTLFEMDNSVGLSSFLAAAAEYEGIIKKSPYLGLDVITAGPIPPNPSELLNSPRMRELIDALSAAYDYIIIDSPPVLGMSDSLILSTATDAVIVVAKANSTPGDALKQASNALQSVNAKILGVILNGVSYKSKYAYSSYYSSPYLKEKSGRRKLLSR